MATANDALESFTIVDVAVVDNETFAFVAYASDTHARWKDGDDFPARLVTHNHAKGSWGWQEYEQFMGGAVAGGRSPEGHKMAVFTNLLRQVFVYNYKYGPNDEEQMIPTAPGYAGPHNIAFVGEHFYGLSYDAIVMRRKAPGEWENLHVQDGGENLTAIDGFSESDLYATGFDKTLIHFDGTSWTQQTLPLDAMEEHFSGEAIVCAPNGVVYVGGKHGQLLAGEAGGRWELLLSDDESVMGNINDMTWFKGVLYATTYYALYRFADGKWELAHFPDSERQPVGASYVDSNDDVMLLAGPYSASIYDGSQWTPIYGDYDDLDLMRLQLAEKLVDDLETIRDTAKDVARAVREQE